MIWEVEIRSSGRDSERERVRDEFDLLTHTHRGSDVVLASSRGWLLEGDVLTLTDVERLADELLCDRIVETAIIHAVGAKSDESVCTVLFKPGVMDPAAESVRRSARDIGIPVDAVRSFRRYALAERVADSDRDLMIRKVLANDAIERVVRGPIHADHLALGATYDFKLIVVPLRHAGDDDLIKISREGGLALSLDEMRTIRDHFVNLQRDPTDAELETIAQTWSEHCSHKTLKGAIEFTEIVGDARKIHNYHNLLKETVFAATKEIRERLGADDWCVSVFSDNAGIVKLDDKNHVCIKVETHNRPSAIEPYGGANTGLGGVIRDILGTGLGAEPICNTDVFCFARPDYPPDELPNGVLHPWRVIQGVVAGVRDYGNRMGIPTVNGAIVFDDRYLANPLVFCGTVGLLPVGKEHKQVRAGDLIVTLGGRTGRDGIHGATFSSEGLNERSEVTAGGAVQIGNAIEEKKVLDVVLPARDRGLFTAITDCGAGGFSSAVGEMGEHVGAVVRLEAAPLKYEGLSYLEVWISESQERMVLAVPLEKWPELLDLAESEGVEATIIGEFGNEGRLTLTYKGSQVADLEMEFLHNGRPSIVRKAEYEQVATPRRGGEKLPPLEILSRILASHSVCSKESVIRRYDHEVKGGSVVKPLVGIRNDGPSDAAVVNPTLGSPVGITIGCGINPLYADLDPYASAAAAIDEAVRNVVAVGADASRIAILDNFCWGNINDPRTLGALVRASEACRDVAIAYGTPFVSGKDSLNNEYVSPNRKIVIPHTLLITALGRIADIRSCVTMDLKEVGNDLYLIGVTKDELGGSHLNLVVGATGGTPPSPDLKLAPSIFAAVHAAIVAGSVRACHDLSEGGLAVALAEMAFAGEIGVEASLAGLPGADGLSDEVRLFSESTTRFLVEARPDNVISEICLGLPCVKIGRTVATGKLRIDSASGERLIEADLLDLKESWQKTLR